MNYWLVIVLYFAEQKFTKKSKEKKYFKIQFKLARERNICVYTDPGDNGDQICVTVKNKLNQNQNQTEKPLVKWVVTSKNTNKKHNRNKDRKIYFLKILSFQVLKLRKVSQVA